MQSLTPAKLRTINRSKEIVSQSSVLESMDTDTFDETGSIDFQDTSSIVARRFIR